MLSSVVLASSAAVAAHPGLVGHPWGWGGGGPGFLLLLVPLFWIAVIAVLFATVGRRWRRAAWAQRVGADQPGRRAEATLAERFAQGDIDEVEYRARLEVIRTNNPAPQYPGR
ncbi:SHOCT domain-containing protein [Herbiconiux sp. A18JL235]|uniref:SHOCT domain-containing protein n=1 Tax=Herbiconiux sp. A18JL235 TaxID=3152363 RepID=A0AB39BK43_9MICO